ncbi:hypothetical protein PHMEG_00023350 [Phytophthora megakarya]|uniref:Reverse transcriptase Ty1/copia-type domain-containing protein n=1 Tax=Phytophthora megakarya TaxID=4795 RepID=A0A225VH29_9STRA|nr:hypothetical protein PHMEG_00023350 [Phytophthora megakarya]
MVSSFTIVLLNIDDIVCATRNEEFKMPMFEKLDEDYGLKDQSLLNTYLGVQVEPNDTFIKVHQTKRCEGILEQFNFADTHAINDTDNAPRKCHLNMANVSYRELIESLMYLVTCTRPDLAYVVGQPSRYVQSPTQHHIGAAKEYYVILLVLKSNGLHTQLMQRINRECY